MFANPLSGLLALDVAAPMPAPLQVASALFFLAALFGDQLVVRVCLAAAYASLLMGAVIDALTFGAIGLDAVFWPLATGAIHAIATYRLGGEAWANGLEAEAADADDAALERFLRRRTGAAATDARRLRGVGEWVAYARGQPICDTRASREHLYLVVEGVARAEFRYEGDAARRSTLLASGEYFDLRLLNLAGVYVGFPNEAFEATAETAVRAFRVSTAALVRLCDDHRQFRAFLRVLALDELARAYEKVTAPGALPAPRDAYGRREALAWRAGALARDFAPYDAGERARFLRRPTLLKRLRNGICPLVQPGCLNTFSPLAGEVARKSVENRSITDILAAPLSTPRMPVRLNSYYSAYTRV